MLLIPTERQIMSAYEDMKVDESPSLRISRAVNELLDSAGTVRSDALVTADARTNDSTFVAPTPLSWLRASQTRTDDTSRNDQPRWIGSEADSSRTGIVRRYSEQRVTQARARSDKLAGFRFTHKDNIAVKDYPLTAGNPSLHNLRPRLTSPLLTAIESAGGAIVGANHMAEFALSPTGHNHWLGDGVNPRNEAYLSGGSSSGSAIAVASGACDVSLGTDTGGSVRLPASFCGVVGYKPSNDVFSTTGLIPLSESLDTIGLIASNAVSVRTVADVLFSDDEVVPTDVRDRLDRPAAASLTGFVHLSVSAVRRTCDTAVAAAFIAALTQIGLIDSKEHGTPGASPEVNYDDSDLNRRAVIVVSVEAARNVGRMLDWNWDRLGDQVLSRVSRGTSVSAIEYADAIAERRALQSEFIESVMGKSRFLLTPTSPIPAPKSPSSLNSADPELRSDYMRASAYTRTINYLGLPAISIPLPATDDATSPGLQIIGRPYDDRALLDSAVSLSKMLV